MAFKERVVDLVLRVKDLATTPFESVSSATSRFTTNADQLQRKLRELEDQKSLISQFRRASTAVDRTSLSYTKAKNRLQDLQDKIGESGQATDKQARALAAAQQAADKAEKEYRESADTLNALAIEAKESGIELGNMSQAQRDNEKATRQAKRELKDFNKSTGDGRSRLSQLNQSLSRGILSFAKWGAAAAAAGAAASIALLTRFTAQQGALARQILATSRALNISTESLQGWSFAARTVGIDAEKVSDLMKDVSEKIGDAFLTGGGEAAEVLRGLNIEVEELVKLAPDQQLLRIAQELEKLDNQSDRVFVMEALANDASLLLPLLDQNAAKLKELLELASERGVIISDEDLEALAEVDRSLKQITTQLEAFRKKLAVELAPTFTQIANDFDDFLAKNPQIFRDITTILAGLITRTKEWVTVILENREGITATFDSFLNSAKFVTNAIIGLFRGVQTILGGILTLGSGIFALWSKEVQFLAFLLQKVGAVSKSTYQSIKFQADNAVTTTIDLASKTAEYGREIADAGKSALSAFDQTGRSASSASTLIDGLGNAVRDLADDLGTVAQEQEQAGTKSDQLAEKAAELSVKLFEVEEALEAAGAALTDDSTEEARQNYENLRLEVERLREQLHETLNAGLAEDVNTFDLSGIVAELRRVFKASDEAADATKRVGRQIVYLQEGLEETGDTAERVGAQAVESADSIGSAIAAIFSGWINEIDSLSTKAAALFNEKLGFGRVAEEATQLESQLAAVNARLADMNSRIRSTGIAGILRDWAKAGLETKQAFLEQAVAMEALTEKIRAGDHSARDLTLTAERLERRFTLLDGSQLQPLIQAIQDARREVDQMNESLEDTITNTLQEIAALRGEQSEVERLRFQERQLELQETLNRARELGDKTAIQRAEQALRLLKQAHDLRLAEIKERDQADAERRSDLEADRASQRQDEERERRQDQRLAPTPQQQRGGSFFDQEKVTLDLKINGRSLGELTNVDRDEVRRLIQELLAEQFLLPGG